jgi:hypothetical protein
MAERLPAGHGGGGDSSLELLVDGKGEENRIGGGVLRRGEGSGGRWRSCVRVEGEGGRLNTPQKKKWQEGAWAPLTVDELTTAVAAGQRRWRAQTASVGFGHGRRRGRDGTHEARRRRGQRGHGRKGCRDAGARSRQRT